MANHIVVQDRRRLGSVVVARYATGAVASSPTKREEATVRHPPPGPMPPQPMYPTPGPAYSPPPPMPRGTSRTGLVMSVVVAVAMTVVAGALAAALVVSHPNRTATPPHPPTSPAITTPAMTAEQAKAETCAVLKEGYDRVADAVDEWNKYTSTPWSDPDLLRATDSLVYETSQLADKLDETLSDATPRDLRSAMGEYIVGLRAVAISRRDHAPDKELNGVALLYRQVMIPPLRICGIE